MDDFFQVGIITTAHGVKGEVKVYPTTDDAARFKKLKNVIVDNGKSRETKKITQVKFFKQFVIMKLEGIDTMDDALLYKNAALYVERKNAVKCDKDEYYIADLIGIKAYDESGNLVGTITDVLQTGANDCYEITREDGVTFLLPAIKECVLSVDVKNEKMTVFVMEGLV